MTVVRKYKKCLDQCINFDKSSLLFGKRVLVNIKETIKNTLGIQNEGGMGSYLRILEDISRSKCNLFAFLMDMLQNIVNSRTER